MRSYCTTALLVSSLLAFSVSNTNSINAEIARGIQPTLGISTELSQQGGILAHRGSGRRELVRFGESAQAIA
jgi:hypothetical protein